MEAAVFPEAVGPVMTIRFFGSLIFFNGSVVFKFSAFFAFASLAFLTFNDRIFFLFFGLVVAFFTGEDLFFFLALYIRFFFLIFLNRRGRSGLFVLLRCNANALRAFGIFYFAVLFNDLEELDVERPARSRIEEV